MIRVSLLVFSFFALCAITLNPARAAESAQFFSSIQDVPLMPGLRELPEQTVMFDNPEGRIVESVALIESGAQERLANFYNATLPQLGWERNGELSYRRDSEFLSLSVESLGAQKFVRVTVSPSALKAN